MGDGTDGADRRMTCDCLDGVKKNGSAGKLAVLLREWPADAVAAACGDDERDVARHDPSFGMAKIKSIVLAADSPLLLSRNLIDERIFRWLAKPTRKTGG